MKKYTIEEISIFFKSQGSQRISDVVLSEENIDQAIANTKLENKVEAKITQFLEANWVKGYVSYVGKEGYGFEAKVYDNPSDFGINGGRVSKLHIEWGIASYDRGWDTKVKKSNLPFFNAVMELLENSPKRLSSYKND